MKFITENLERGQRSVHAETARYTVSELFSNRSAYVDRKPRRDSKYWDDSRYLIWDNKRNEKA